MSLAGDFAVQEEKIESVAEAMGILRECNPEWKPKFFMCDFSEVEIQAIESCESWFSLFFQDQYVRKIKITTGMFVYWKYI